ncbi:hypothetical protein JYU34_008923, partial [Plutella xylostella]
MSESNLNTVQGEVEATEVEPAPGPSKGRPDSSDSSTESSSTTSSDSSGSDRKKRRKKKSRRTKRRRHDLLEKLAKE